MARNVALVAFGVLVGMVAGAAFNLHAQDLDDQALELAQVASETGIDPVLLHGAVNSTGLRPRAYLISVGELPPPIAVQPARDWVDGLLDCLAWAESRNTPSARNPRSGASGLLQFLPSTWMSTPQGRAGASIWDGSAQRAAARWMIAQGRLHEWSTWRQCA